MKPELFEKIIKQIVPHKRADLDNFWIYIVDSYKILSSERSKNVVYFKLE